MTVQSRKRTPSLLLLALATALVACRPQSQSEDFADEIRIAISPAVQPVSLALLSCASSHLAEDQQLVVRSGIADSIELEDFDFAIQLGEATKTAKVVAALAEEKLLIILHPSNPMRDLSRAQMADLFRGRIGHWNLLEGNDAEVALWIASTKDEARRAFESELLAGSPVSGNARLATSPQHMLDAVGGDVHAIGLLPAAWVDSSVKSLDSGLMLPVLVLAQGELSREARAIVACLQGEQGQSILAARYSH